MRQRCDSDATLSHCGTIASGLSRHSGRESGLGVRSARFRPGAFANSPGKPDTDATVRCQEGPARDSDVPLNRTVNVAAVRKHWRCHMLQGIGLCSTQHDQGPPV